jgi:hypothetical protein
MSSRAAIGTVSAVLVDLLKAEMSDLNAAHSLFPNEVHVTATAPDLVEITPDTNPQLNLFLYRVSPNQGWWNVGQPARAGDGTVQCSPPLALNLHYLLTAYGQSDYQAELMMGYAMHLLHRTSLIDPATLQQALSLLPPGFNQLGAPDLADQPESITITLEPSNTEEIARLWTAISTNYRPTATYVVTVVLLQTHAPQQSPLPVLQRGPGDRGVLINPSLDPPLPTLTGVGIPDGQTAARLGDPITLHGYNLAGTGPGTGNKPILSFTHPLQQAPVATLSAPGADPRTVTVTLPTPAPGDTTWLAGPYTVTFTVQPPLDDQQRTTNAVTLPLAPTLNLPPDSITRAADKTISVTLTVEPPVYPGQDVWLFLGSTGAPMQSLSSPSDTLTFDLPAVPAGPQWVRLRVDGVESQLIDTSTTPPSFISAQSVTVPA